MTRQNGYLQLVPGKWNHFCPLLSICHSSLANYIYIIQATSLQQPPLLVSRVTAIDRVHCITLTDNANTAIHVTHSRDTVGAEPVTVGDISQLGFAAVGVSPSVTSVTQQQVGLVVCLMTVGTELQYGRIRSMGMGTQNVALEWEHKM